ncbi:MAG: hypothetical protein P4L99_12790 [Chthoniobacter sp.]|nr:hypothetical protein [Chthoniobacter sp.]
MEEPWPAVEWGMQPTAGGMGEDRGRPTLRFTEDAPPILLSLDSSWGNVVMHFRAHEDDGLGPVVSIDALPNAEGETNRPKELKPEPGALRLGNVSFNQAADSFNVGKPDDGKANDLSRQFGGTGVAAKNVVTATPINGWAIAGIAALAVVAALAIGFFENDRDDRLRRKKNRRRKHRHSS